MKNKLNQGVDMDAMDEDGWTPLLIAAFFRNNVIVEQLIAKGADVNAKGRRGVTPLHKASVGGGEILEMGHDCFNEVPELLIAKGANLNAKDEEGLTPLMYAVLEGQKEIAELLIAKGADVNVKDGDCETALHYAASFSQNEIFELLIKNGAEVNAKDDWGRTPLDRVNDESEITNLVRKNGGKTAALLNAKRV